MLLFEFHGHAMVEKGAAFVPEFGETQERLFLTVCSSVVHGVRGCLGREVINGEDNDEIGNKCE